MTNVTQSILLKTTLLGALMGISSRVGADGSDWGKELGELKARVHQLEEMKSLPQVSLHGILVGNVQTEAVQESEPDSKNVSRGVYVFQPEVSVRVSPQDEIFFKFGFAGGKGLGAVSSFHLAPWAGGGEDDVIDINGRSRDYLLTSWYKPAVEGNAGRLEVTGGIIDATEYLDENAFANDEFSQFMNEALVNGPHVFAPSYDVGGAIRAEKDIHSLSGVVMNVGENVEGNSFAFYGLQYGAKLKSGLGEGNYRLIFESTNKKFLNVDGDALQSRHGLFLSCDQELGRKVGGWIRWGVQDEAASVHCKNLYSGGVHLRGDLWGRSADHVGVGHALLNGGNDGLKQSEVSEVYWHLGLNDTVSFNWDVQHLRDTYDDGAGSRVQGWVSSLMMSTGF